MHSSLITPLFKSENIWFFCRLIYFWSWIIITKAEGKKKKKLWTVSVLMKRFWGSYLSRCGDVKVVRRAMFYRCSTASAYLSGEVGVYFSLSLYTVTNGRSIDHKDMFKWNLVKDRNIAQTFGSCYWAGNPAAAWADHVFFWLFPLKCGKSRQPRALLFSDEPVA